MVKDSTEKKTMQLAQAIHHLICENELLKHENEGWREAHPIKKKRQSRGRPFRPREEDSEHGGAKWWSPRSIRREKRRLEQEDKDKQDNELQILADRDARKSAQQLRARLAAERRIVRGAKSERKQREKAAATALRIQRRKEAAVAKSRRRIKPQHRSKLHSDSAIKGSEAEETGGGERAGGAGSALLALPATFRSGRHMNPPKKISRSIDSIFKLS